MSEKEAWEKYMDASTALEREMVSAMGQEAYDASQHWVNNPLIKPISKLGILNDALAKAWEEGFRSGFDYADPRFVAGYPPVNPYRQGEN